MLARPWSMAEIGTEAGARQAGLPIYMTLGKLLPWPDVPFPHLCRGDNRRAYLLELRFLSFCKAPVVCSAFVDDIIIIITRGRDVPHFSDSFMVNSVIQNSSSNNKIVGV